MDLSGEQLAYVATTVAVTLANGLSPDEINILGEFLNVVADVLSLIATQRDTQS